MVITLWCLVPDISAHCSANPSCMAAHPGRCLARRIGLETLMMVADDEAASLDGAVQDPASSDLNAGSPDTGDIHTYIGVRLRKAFDDVAKQPVPERFLQLMRDLDQK